MTDKEVMQMALETAEQIACADYRHWEELASLGEFERWARSRANHIADALRTALAETEPEPVACPFPCGWKTMLSIIIKDGAFLARGLTEGEPVTGHQREIVMRLIDYAKTMASHGMTAPPQPEQKPVIDGNTSDGYHTFNELYEFRKAYNIALFNEWAANGKCFVHKSWRHNDGELCFGGGWFIVVAVLPQGQISNHYEAKDWDLFHIQETEKALFEFDGHTGADVIERLKSYTIPPQRTWVNATTWRGLTDEERINIWCELPLTRNAERDACVFSECIELYLKEKNT